MSNRLAATLILLTLAGCVQPPVGRNAIPATATRPSASVAIGIAWPRAMATQAIPRDTQTVFITIRDGAGTAIHTDDPVARPAGQTLKTVTYTLKVGTGYTLDAVAKSGDGTTLATGTTTFNVADGTVPTDPVTVDLAMVPASTTRYIHTVAGSHLGSGIKETVALGRTTGLARAADGTLYMGTLAKNTLLKLTGNLITLFSGGPVGLTAPVGTPSILGMRWYGTGGLALDSYGNLFGTDIGTHTIKLMVQGEGTPAGYFGIANPVVGKSYVIAGTYGVTGSADGTGTAAKFNVPGGIAFGPNDDLFVCDTLNGRIRRIAKATGAVSTFTPLPMAIPINLVYNGTDFWVTETSGHVLRRISGTTGLSQQTIGSFLNQGNVDGAIANVRFRTPTALTQGPAGHLIITDQRSDGKGWNLKDVDLTGGQVTTLATHFIGVPSDFVAPSVVWDGASSYIISDDVLKIWNGTALSVHAGNGNTSTTLPLVNGSVATQVQIGNPVGVAVDSARTMWTVTNDGALRTIGAAGLLQTILPIGSFNQPSSVTVDASDNVYVCTNGDGSVYRIPAGDTAPARLIGTGTGGMSGNGTAAAQISMPSQVAVDAHGNVFVADTGNHAIRMRWQGGPTTYGIAGPVAGNVYTIAGTLGSAGSATTPATPIGSLLNGPKGVAVDAAGNVLFSDSANYVVRMIYAGETGGGAYGQVGLVHGEMVIIAGTPGVTGWSDGSDGGQATSASLGRPQALATDALGNVYICDYLDVNNPSGGYVFKVSADGTIHRIAGAGPSALNGYGDGGDPRDAALDGPAGVWVDRRGDTIYLAPGAGDTIRMITP